MEYKSVSKFINLFILFLSSILFCSCLNDLFILQEEPYIQEYTYDANHPYVEIEANCTKLNLKGIKGKSITFATINPNLSIANSAQIVVSNQVVRNVSNEITTSESLVQGNSNRDKIVHYGFPVINPADVTVDNVSIERNIVPLYSEVETETFDINNPTVGQTKNIYVDDNENMDTYSKEKCTLYAIEEIDTDTKCFVWICDKNFDSTARENKVNNNTAQKIAEIFKKYYKHMCYVFGEESDVINVFTNNKIEKMNLSNYPTGKNINIILYDIGNEENGVVGYFYSKDYFSTTDTNGNKNTYSSNNAVLNYSNEGKYLYIDSQFCNFSGYSSDGTFKFEGSDDGISNFIKTTLFHEFQHMINYNQKTIINNKSSSTWYNEMLSMLAEDMLQTSLEIPNSEAPCGERMPTFNKYYYVSGITDWLDERIYSYSSAYAFGAWLCRSYGGPKLVQSMSQNDKTDFESILKALKEQNNKEFTIEQLMNEYVQACVFRTEFAKEHDLPTFNKNSSTETNIEYDGVISKMKAFDIFSKPFYYEEDNKFWSGPLLASNKKIYKIRPTGFFLSSIGVSEENDDVTFSITRNSPNAKIVVYIQDSFKNKVTDN